MKINQIFCRHIDKYEKAEFLGNRFIPSEYYSDEWHSYKRMAVTFRCIKCGRIIIKEQIMPMEIENER